MEMLLGAVSLPAKAVNATGERLTGSDGPSAECVAAASDALAARVGQHRKRIGQGQTSGSNRPNVCELVRPFGA
jgi:hypothetical protein